ncbi:phosphatase PAP2 family protein [Sphingomonas sp. GCM10030256]|uniref:phosphatase PAP2 family protein n=1 Tax=Sphingomonas sp. GCM10030256 TaxID=3273427 RepID=UPI003610C358
MPKTISAFTAAVAATITLLLVIVLGLSSLSFDVAISQHFSQWRAAQPNAVRLMVLFTDLGGSQFLLPLALVAGLAAAWRRRFADAMLLAATVIGGRLLIEGMKIAFARPRPAFDAHPVTTFSLSFPSGHAGNAMVTYLAIALFALPPRWRAPGAAGAILLSLAIGATRPLLGVHWPTDVLGGWLFGLAWVWLCAEAGRRFTAS